MASRAAEWARLAFFRSRLEDAGGHRRRETVSRYLFYPPAVIAGLFYG